MRHEACAGALVYDAHGRMLVVRRGHAPSLGAWCEPSGRCEAGESAMDAAVRECAEETGIAARAVREAGTVSVRADKGGETVQYDITGVVCELVGGDAHAGDDAAEVRWAGALELDLLELAPGVRDALSEWGALPR